MAEVVDKIDPSIRRLAVERARAVVRYRARLVSSAEFFEDQDDYIDLITKRILPVYTEWIKSLLRGRGDSDMFVRRVTRAVIVAMLLGMRSATQDIKEAGHEVEISGDKLEPSPEAYELPRGILSMPMDKAHGEFVKSLNLNFANSVPNFKLIFPRVLRFGSRAAWFITGVESEWIIKDLGKMISRQLKSGQLDPTAFLDRGTELTELSEGRLKTVFRTTVGQAANAGRWMTYQTPAVQAITPLYEYQAVLDSRVRPHHAVFDGFVHDSTSAIWRHIWPLNGYNCRCLCAPIFGPDAERRGYINKRTGALNMGAIKRTWRKPIKAGLLTPSGTLTGAEVTIGDVTDTFPAEGFGHEMPGTA